MNDKRYFCEVTSGDETKTSEEISVSVGNYIYYDANGGYGAPDTQKKNYGEGIILSSKEPKRDGYNFNGWSSSKNAVSVEYKPGANYSNNKTITLYAVWIKKAEPTPTPTPKPTATPKPTETPKPTAAPSDASEIYKDINNITCSVQYLTVKSGGWQKPAVKIKWNKCKTAYRYELHRSESEYSGYKKIKAWNSETTKYTDKKVKKGVTYYYKVMAYGGTAVKSYTGDFSSPVKVVVSSKLKKPKLEFKIKKRKI